MNTTHLTQENINTAALQIFESISNQWGLSDCEKCSLLGFPSENISAEYPENDITGLFDEDVLQRISQLLGINKALHQLLPTANAANQWVHQPNSAPLFIGNTALSQLLNGNLSDFSSIRHYLDAQCQ